MGNAKSNILDKEHACKYREKNTNIMSTCVCSFSLNNSFTVFKVIVNREASLMSPANAKAGTIRSSHTFPSNVIITFFDHCESHLLNASILFESWTFDVKM